MIKEKDLGGCSNDELGKIMNNLANNHTKLKEEILQLTDILTEVELEYVKVIEVLKTRGVVK